MEERQTSPFHVFHKVPTGDGLYVRAKHVQLLEKDPKKAIALFGAALEAGDRVDSALKDMAIVLKQQNRPQDAILAIQTFRTRCSDSAQDSLDNVLLDLYRICGRLDEQIALLIRKLELLNRCQSFNGKCTKTARSQGKKIQVSVEQETARLLSNLGWAYMQNSDFVAAESVYRTALAFEVDNNKVCNLGVCLMKQGRAEEAMQVLRRASYPNNKRSASESHFKSYRRAQELLQQASSMSTQTSHLPLAEEDARNIGEMVAAACLGECDDTQERNHGDCKSNGEVGTFPVDQTINGDCTSSSPPTPSLVQPPSSDLVSSAQGRMSRRLPVFREITVLGRAAA